MPRSVAGTQPGSTAGNTVPDARQLGGLIRLPGAMGFGGPGGGRAAPAIVGAGDYLVTISVGGQTATQVLRVERLPGAGNGGSSTGQSRSVQSALMH